MSQAFGDDAIPENMNIVKMGVYYTLALVTENVTDLKDKLKNM